MPSRFSFAGSDELAAQIQQGVKPDVFASANTKLPDALYARGPRRRPVVFAGNRLVIAVPGRHARRSTALDDLAQARRDDRDRLRKDVPIGAYTRTVLGSARPAQDEGDPRQRALRGARRRAASSASSTQGAVDAGFVYVTDVHGDGRQAERDRAAGLACSRTSPTASPS